MNREKELEKLFKEIHQKPDGLNDRIMQIIQEESMVHKPNEGTVKQKGPFIWSGFILLALSLLGLITAVSKIDFGENPLIWIIFLATLIPIMAEKYFLWKSIKL